MTERKTEQRWKDGSQAVRYSLARRKIRRMAAALNGHIMGKYTHLIPKACGVPWGTGAGRAHRDAGDPGPPRCYARFVGATRSARRSAGACARHMNTNSNFQPPIVFR